MARGGRKRKNGDRHPCGKLRLPVDYGCDGVQRRRASYATPANDSGKSNSDHTFDPIGRAWSAGLLEHPEKDSAAIRDAGRDLEALYWRHYGIGAHRDTLARFVPSSSSNSERCLETALNARLDPINRMGHHIRRAVDKLCLDEPAARDHGPAWLDRLIWAKRRRIDPWPQDARILADALKGLAAIV